MLPLEYRHSRGWGRNPQLISYGACVLLHAVHITIWDPSFTCAPTQGQLAGSKPRTRSLGLKSTTPTTRTREQTVGVKTVLLDVCFNFNELDQRFSKMKRAKSSCK